MYELIYNIVKADLMPAAHELYHFYHVVYINEMKTYTVKHTMKGGHMEKHESEHEKKVFLLHSQLSVLQNNVTLIATQVKDKVNAILSSQYGIIATYAFNREESMRYELKQKGIHNMNSIVRLEFHMISAAVVAPAVVVASPVFG